MLCLQAVRGVTIGLSSTSGMADSAPKDETPAPIAIGAFRIVRRIGQGGAGSVYEAVDEALARTVAIKVLPPGESELHARLLNEARAVNIIRHRGIVGVSEAGRLADGSSYLVMEYLEGETLRAVLRRRPPLSELLRYARQIASALAAAHGKDILHRDLKPDTVQAPQSEEISQACKRRGRERKESASQFAA